MDSYKKLAKSSLIFAIGNVGSKFIYLFLVPVYTFYLSPKEYGISDLITTTLLLIIPIFTFSIFDAVLRYLIDKKYTTQEILSNGLIVVILGFLISILFYPLLTRVLPFSEYIIYFYALLFIQSINNTLLQFLRGVGKLKLYALNGILSALFVLVGSYAFIVILHLGVIGYILSFIFANLISLIFMIFAGDIIKNISIKDCNYNIIKIMLIYSIPLIPNAVMWWVISASDRYLITYFMGSAANGIYAVATKVPSLLNIINGVFMQAWQISAIEENDSNTKSNFYSNIFNVFSLMLLLTTSIILMFLKPILDTIIASEYQDAWRYVPFLLIGVIFSSFSGFLGANYLATKNTKGIFKTSILGAIINIIGNLILIPLIGINGAAISTMFSFMIISYFRFLETRKNIGLKINKLKIISGFLIIFIQVVISYNNIEASLVLHLLLVLFLVCIYRGEFMVIKNKIRKSIKI